MADRKELVGILQSLGPERFVRFMDETTEDVEKAFQADAGVKAILKRKGETEKKAEAREAPPIRSAGAGKDEEYGGTKRALVIVGALTGNDFVDQAMHNTAVEAESDFNNRGYVTDRLETPSKAMVEYLLSSGQFNAFCFVGHGGDIKAGDSANGTPDGGGGNDFIWPNVDDVIDSWDVQRWMRGHIMDVVILHACVQGQPNTSKRWQTAFSVNKANFYSWSGPCRYHEAYWWQYYWK